MINYISPKTVENLIEKEHFLSSETGERFPKVDGIPRFVPSSGYSEAFGYQWKKFRKTQLDSHSGFPISRDRLERCLGFKLPEIKGKNILEIGCGAGRFTEHLVTNKGNIHSIDLSQAVEANLENIGFRPNYQIAQADIYNIPYPNQSFDIVLCLGVLQHTPDPVLSIQKLWEKVKPGGLLVIDHYTYSISIILKLFWIYRAFLKRMSPEKSMRIVEQLVHIFFPVHWRIRNHYFLQAILSRVSPCLFYYKDYPFLSKEQHYEFTLLDTYDHLTDYYKFLITEKKVEKILKELGGTKIWTNRGGNGIEARCIKAKNS